MCKLFCFVWVKGLEGLHLHAPQYVVDSYPTLPYRDYVGPTMIRPCCLPFVVALVDQVFKKSMGAA